MVSQSLSTALGAPAPTIHPSARLLDNAVETSPEQWSYALTVPVAGGPVSNAMLVAEVDAQVLSGQVGVGLLNRAGTSFVSEIRLEAESSTAVVLRVAADDVSSLILRNTSADGASRFQLRSVRMSVVPAQPRPYPVTLERRNYLAEPVPPERQRVFDDHAADAINTARMDFIRGLELPLQGRRVLDVGAGVGHFARLYADCGAQVVAVEGRAENVQLLRERHRDVEAHVGDIQEMSLNGLGRFDIVHCFGLLYHLDSPVVALRRMATVCDDILLLETMVCDAEASVMILADESRSMNQALTGLGCRPSPMFVALALNRLGFGFVYGAIVPPAHPDFQFEWRNDLSVARDGHNLRCVFVASHRPIVNDCLYPFIEG